MAGARFWLLVGGTACGSSSSASNAPHPRVDYACIEAGHAADVIESSPSPLKPGEVRGKRIGPSGMSGPDLNTVAAMRVYGVKESRPMLKVCVDASGAVTAVDVVRSSCFPWFDAQLVEAASSWRYTPFEENSIAVPACTGVRLRFRVPPK